jgi:hypothetical protein
MWDFRSHICDYEEHCHVFMCVTIDGVWIGELDLLTTCTHHLELHLITALSLISTLYKSLHAMSPLASSVSKGCSLATDSNSRDSSDSHTHIITIWRIFHNWTHSAGLGSLLYSLREEPTENTALNSFSIVVMSGCLAIAQISLMCLLDVTKQSMFLLAIIA